MSIQKGEFIGVYGDVGSGKSSLLYSMAKLLPYYTGQLIVLEEASLQETEPALFSGTIEENVLFGRDKNESLYSKALRYSCLDEDLAQMTAENRL